MTGFRVGIGDFRQVGRLWATSALLLWFPAWALAAGEPGRATPQPYGQSVPALQMPRSPAPQGSAPLLRGPGSAVSPAEPVRPAPNDVPLLPPPARSSDQADKPAPKSVD